MSYLLDALKQSQQSDMSAEQYDLQSEQLKQQRALTRYRTISTRFWHKLRCFYCCRWVALLPVSGLQGTGLLRHIGTCCT